jgi:hypothetical protein
MGSFIHQFLYLCEMTQCYLLDARWVGPRAGLLAVEKEKTSAPAATRIKSQFPCYHIAHSLLFILTLLFQLISHYYYYYMVTKSNVQERHYTGCFIMFSMITNIYNKQTKGSTLIELFTATGKLTKFFF